PWGSCANGPGARTRPAVPAAARDGGSLLPSRQQLALSSDPPSPLRWCLALKGERRSRFGGGFGSRPVAAVCLVCGEPTCGHRRARAAWGAGTSVRPRRLALRANFAAVLGLGARRPLSSARFARCARRRRVSGGCALRAPPPTLR